MNHYFDPNTGAICTGGGHMVATEFVPSHAHVSQAGVDYSIDTGRHYMEVSPTQIKELEDRIVERILSAMAPSAHV